MVISSSSSNISFSNESGLVSVTSHKEAAPCVV